MPKKFRFHHLFLSSITTVLLCLGFMCSETLAVQVTPLAETSVSKDSASLGVTSPLAGPDNSMRVPTPVWTTGTLLPKEMWEHYSKRPSAFGPPPRPLGNAVPGYIPHGVVDSMGRILTPAQAGLTTPRPTTPDPAALPVLSVQDKRTSAGKNAPRTSTYLTGGGQNTQSKFPSPVAPPPVVPSVPSVTPPSAAVVQTTTTPTAPTAPSTPTTAPYSTPVAPTGPVTPSQPTIGVPAQASANSPSIAAQTDGQGTIGSGPISATTQPGGGANGNTGNAKSANGAASTSGATSSTNGGSTAGANVGTAGASGSATGTNEGTNGTGGGTNGSRGSEVMRTLNTTRPPVLGGPAESLVIPPAGISLTPNDVPANLTAPPHP